MARPGGTRHAGGGPSVSGHRLGGSFQQRGMFQGGSGGLFRSTLPSQRTRGGSGMGGFSGPIFYEMGRQSGRREAREWMGRQGPGGYGSYGGGPRQPGYEQTPRGYQTGGPGGTPPGGRTTTQANSARGCSPGCLTVILVVFAVMLLLTLMSGDLGTDTGSGTKSTIERHKLTDVASYDSKCVADQLGWFDSATQTGKDLKTFYDQTGVQPYVIFKSYESALTTDNEKQAWAKAYFDEYIDRDNAFLLVYFAEPNAASDAGYMCQVSGSQTKSIMDSEALNIFWNNIDRYWSGSYTTDEVITKAYSDTASTIMRVSTTSRDILKWAIIAALILGILAAAFFLLRERNRRAKEKAEETERILKTPLETYSGKEGDELIDKYKDPQ